MTPRPDRSRLPLPTPPSAGEGVSRPPKPLVNPSEPPMLSNGAQHTPSEVPCRSDQTSRSPTWS